MTPELTKAAQQALKPHQIAQLVNKLRDIAREFHAHGCLRELISREVNSALTQRPAAQEVDYSEQLTKAKRLLVDLHKIGGAEVRSMIEARTGSWFVWGQDRSLPAPQQATPEPCKPCDGMGYVDGVGDACDECGGQGATPEPVGEVVWIQPNHLQMARVAPHLCRVAPTRIAPDFVPLSTRPAPGVPEDVANLLCSVADNLNDMPISDEYAAKTAKKAYDLLVKYGLVSTPSELLAAAQAKGEE